MQSLFDLSPQFDSKITQIYTLYAENTGRPHTCNTSGGSLKFFEDEEVLKGRHILIENYKAILSQDNNRKCLYNGNK